MTTFSIGSATLTLDPNGCVSSILSTDKKKQEFTPRSYRSPFIQLGINGKLKTPRAMKETSNLLIFSFDDTCEVSLRYETKSNYTIFQVAEVKGAPEVLVFGPIFTTLASSIGDIVGICQSEDYTLGIQALNLKTLGGFPEEYRSQRSQFVINEAVSELSVASLDYCESAGYRAKIDDEPCGMLQLYGENRKRHRIRNIMGYADIPVAPMEDAETAALTGCAFALFFCENNNALCRIGEIEIAEGLPHPMLNGEWVKTARPAMQSYLIAEFGESNLDKLLVSTKKAGFSYLYHPEPFSDWGHFTLNKAFFPKGDESLLDYCEQAEKQGIFLGLHTLTAFTTPNDRYVSPVPNQNLAKLGGSSLTLAIAKEDGVISVVTGDVFKKVTTLQTIQIEDELIQYEEVQENRLVGCLRGAFGTKPASHPADCSVMLLLDHPYRVFFPNLQLQSEYSDRIATLFNKTGAAQISFDGLEGCEATGEDVYGMNVFCMKCHNKFNRNDIINDASRLNHNLWHLHTRMNWGEPWGKKMREGMLEYRIRNQDFYRRNLFPRMLGWFLIRKADRKFEATPREDIEWALSMAAGFDAGFALSTSQAVIETNGCADELLEAVKNWEGLRLSNSFSSELQERLRDPKTEWRLEKQSDNRFTLYELCISKPLICDLLELQPGQPGGSDWVYQNAFEEQPYEFRMRVEGNGEIVDPSFITKKGILKFRCRVKGGQYLIFSGNKAQITDRNYRPLQEVAPIGEGIVQAGQQAFSFSCGFEGEEGPEVTVTLFTKNRGIDLCKF